MFENDGLKIFFHNLVIFLAKYECSNGAMVDTYGAVVGGLSNQGPFLWFCGHDMACPRTPLPVSTALSPFFGVSRTEGERWFWNHHFPKI